MSTARDLALVVLGRPLGRTVEQGDLSLALAGAETVDLLESGALTLDGERMVPGGRTATGDPLLDEAVAALVRREPYETVGDWLWRRGAELSAAYVEDLTRTGFFVRSRRLWLSVRGAGTVPADTPQRRRAEHRLATGEPVLAALTAALDAGDPPASTAELGEAVTTVLAAVGNAVTELEAARLRRDAEHAAFDNIWRA
ncbi:GPP34 family phosphoprotein [Streptomyces humi]|uniref:GPP34 family phosphoprotein n=1 Tax=Streptomyces humi TaxID=1428620 RepID=UPI00062879F5|nr:GPP34 family phosphoprotein [Streptomyces humi]